MVDRVGRRQRQMGIRDRGNGGWAGKSLDEATQTRGGYVPEQHTDFIFSAIGEVSGLLGTTVTIVLFMLLIYRVIIMAERQRNIFARIYGME